MPKTAKTIFHTTEKSNFILNMKEHEYHRFNLRILLLFMVLMPTCSLITELARWLFASDIYSVPAMALLVTGVFALVFVFIGYMKSATPRSLIAPTVVIGAMAVWCGVSVFNSYFYNVSIIGFDGRNEGWLAVIFYGCFFLLGAQLGTDSNRQKLLRGLMWMGLAECAWGLLQCLPIHTTIVNRFSAYEDLEPLMLRRVFLPSGLTGSPILLATLLVMLLFPAMLGAAFAGEKKQQRFYTICAAVFALMAVKTQCLIGLCGTALAIAAAAVCVLVKKGGRSAWLRTGAAVLAFGIGLGWVLLSPSINGTYSNVEAADNTALLYDGGIIWEDGAYRLAASGYYVSAETGNPNGGFDVSSLTDTYRYHWSGAAKIATRFPLVGSGPDSLTYPQLYQHADIVSNPNVFDRTYDDYLHIAATMGFPMLALFLVLVCFVIVRGRKGCAGENGSWLHIAVFGSVVLYLIMMVIGSSSVTVAPVFWMLAGCCLSLGSKQDT